MHRICKNKNEKGFTLIELMIVVAIIGILAAVAIPQFLDMMKSSKRSEAEINLDAIKKGAKAYAPEAAGWPVGTDDPALDCCADGDPKTRKCAPDPSLWTSGDPDAPNVWDELNFALDEAHHFSYAVDSDGAVLTATATGDLDCDGTPVVYTLVGDWNSGNPTWTLTKPARAD